MSGLPYLSISKLLYVFLTLQAETVKTCTLFASLAPDRKLMFWDTAAVQPHKRGLV